VAVASVETEIFPATPFNITYISGGTGNTETAGYIPSGGYFPNTVVGWPIVPMTLDTTVLNDGCTPFPAGTPSLAGKIPLVRRGTCSFSVKQANVAALGARYILIYNNAGTLTAPSTDITTSSIAMITADLGASIIETVKAGGSVTADFSVNPETIVALSYSAGGRPNTFTSWGGLWDLQMKPDIAAPGGNIYSTYINNGFALSSGTSMACPYVAGVAALYISLHGGRSVNGKGFAKELAKRIVSSGKELPWSDGTATDYGFSAPPAQVGNGMIDAYKVLFYTTSLDFQKMALNDTHYFSRYHDVTVKNSGSEPVSYGFSVQYGAGVNAMGRFPVSGSSLTTMRLKSRVELSPIRLEPEVSLPRPFTLAPGESKTVS
jgi:subtilisin family serine protease